VANQIKMYMIDWCCIIIPHAY